MTRRDADRAHVLQIEAPDRAGMLDFIDIGTVCATVEKRSGRRVIVITVKLDNGDGYSWAEHEHVIAAPIRKRIA